MGMSETMYAVFLFFFYTICDWLPLFVIFVQHFQDFRRSIKEIKEERERLISPNPQGAETKAE